MQLESNSCVDWFFNSPWVKAQHNLFHSPLLDAGYILLGYWLWKQGYRGGAWLFWFAIACMIHTLIDIPLHYQWFGQFLICFFLRSKLLDLCLK